ncbi:hypothetical protein CC86DRAFT_382270 [Ophiobolus disseminans]|uniref:Uncharacterized protein n=1 Tax=Ophiobolus disseminans TaxID=1469910 RepID=A0A6A6ZZW2_9PLEO|nr:hypothetical protein CC86DRAFT_382270 [Ophiobolus disseminans]
MQAHILTDTSPLPRSLFWSFINAHTVNEISNHPGAVRRHIFHSAMLDTKKKRPGKTEQDIHFCIFQTGRYGPQNGYRFVVVHKGYDIGGPEKKEGESEDDIDRLEREIPQGHEEMVVLGEPELFEDPVEDEDGN